MKYDQMAELVLTEIPERSEAAGILSRARTTLFESESMQARAYVRFREGLRLAAELGNERAADYLERTTWDLT